LLYFTGDEDDGKQCEYLKVSLSPSTAAISTEEGKPLSTKVKHWANQDVQSGQCTLKKISNDNVEWDNSSIGEWHKVLECHGNQGCKSLFHGNLVSKWSKCFPPTPKRCNKSEIQTGRPYCHPKDFCSEFDEDLDSIEGGRYLTEFWDDEYDFLLKHSPRKVIKKFSVDDNDKLEQKLNVVLETNENKES
jgi:hypothetical protein